MPGSLARASCAVGWAWISSSLMIRSHQGFGSLSVFVVLGMDRGPQGRLGRCSAPELHPGPWLHFQKLAPDAVWRVECRTGMASGQPGATCETRVGRGLEVELQVCPADAQSLGLGNEGLGARKGWVQPH